MKEFYNSYYKIKKIKFIYNLTTEDNSITAQTIINSERTEPVITTSCGKIQQYYLLLPLYYLYL